MTSDLALSREEEDRAFDTDWAARLDASARRIMAGLPSGSPPVSSALAMAEWWAGWAMSPGTQMAAMSSALTCAARFWSVATLGGADAIAPARDDHRFAYPSWRDRPFSLFVQAFLLAEGWIDEVVAATPSVSPHRRAMVRFIAKQALDAMSPSNFPWLNPEVIERTAASGGHNLVQGFRLWREDNLPGPGKVGGGAEDLARDAYVVGRDVAVTPGVVVFRNDLIELIQYAPTTPVVRAEPILIVPAWIMKYYILDLSPHNSMIRWLVDQGFTVFCLSWRNPGPELRDTTFDDYRVEGLQAALTVALAITGAARAHLAGYCLGGTLAAIAAAAMARDADDRIASLTLLAAQTDFSEAGGLSLFIDEQQLPPLEAMMAETGYLDGGQMAGAFALLADRDLIWSRAVRAYLLGEAPPNSDLMAWNRDTTRMPARMHAEYLRQMFLENRLATGHCLVDGRPVSVGDIRKPIFAVGTETDHVAPWRSVFKIHLLDDADVTFVLTAGGHNAGIVSEPGHPRRHYRIAERPAGGAYVDPDSWQAAARPRDGSWWTAWAVWLAAHSTADAPPPPKAVAGATFPDLAPAPGTYVREG